MECNSGRHRNPSHHQQPCCIPGPTGQIGPAGPIGLTGPTSPPIGFSLHALVPQTTSNAGRIRLWGATTTAGEFNAIPASSFNDGIYTAPVSGYYYTAANLNSANTGETSPANVTFNLSFNDINTKFKSDASLNSVTGNAGVNSFSTTVFMNANDTLRIRNFSGFPVTTLDSQKNQWSVFLQSVA